MTWAEICDDKRLQNLPFRIESDRWGNIVMSLPPRSRHGEYQFEKGAVEFWLCDEKGGMTFYDAAEAIPKSNLCPQFPDRIEV